MSAHLHHNVDPVEAALRGLLGDVPKLLEELGRFADVRISARAIGRMRDAPGEGPRRPSDDGPVRVLSGRLARGVASKFGTAAGGTRASREGRLELDVTDRRLRVRKVIEVPYAAIQEYGGTVTITITARMRRFFWAKFYESGDEKWKGLALTKKSELSITLPARPFAEPALKEATPEIREKGEALLRDRLIDRLNRRVA